MTNVSEVTYQFEHERRLRVGFIGAGAHSYRNVYPTFQYAPIDLRAVCDVNRGQAAAYARLFGAAAFYNDFREMLEQEELDAVFIVTGYDETGEVQATELAEECLRAGLHVWMEKPTASTLAAVSRLESVAAEFDRVLMTGLKKMFTPAMEKVKQIISTPDFGSATSIAVRYPQDLVPLSERGNPLRMLWFLDHIYHPAAVLLYLMGPVERMSYEWEPRAGASVTNFCFKSGAIGTLHLTAGQSGTSPLERIEVVGVDSNVIVENGVQITYHRKGADRGYGRRASFVVDDEVAPLRWEPEFSLGQLYNKNLFYLGYAQEVIAFCNSVLEGEPIDRGSLAYSKQIMAIYEAYRDHPAGAIITIGARP